VPEPSSKRLDLWIVLLLALCTGLMFWPATRWIAEQTLAREQIKQSALILVFAAGWLAWRRRGEIRIAPKASKEGIVFLAFSYLCVAAAIYTHAPLFIFGGLVLAFAAFLHFLGGAVLFAHARPIIYGFGAFLAIILLFPLLDWPLRQLAGLQAAKALQLLGLAPQLSLVTQPEIKLILSLNRQLFEVATECNGFGLITSGALLALLLVSPAARPALDKVLVVIAALFVGFLFNLFRILGITLLAPSFPNHYYALHETMGIAALYSGLAFVWWLATVPQRQAPEAPATGAAAQT
jgi:exosortase/archaeosortase family protein